MDDRTFYDYMMASANPYHVASTGAGAMVQQTKSAQRLASGGSTWRSAPRRSVDEQGPVPAGGGGGPAKDGSAGMVVPLTVSLVRLLWPLNLLERLGRRITRIGWRGRLPLSFVGAVVLPGLLDLGHPLVGATAGAIGGWAVLPTVGVVIALVAILTGFAIALGILSSGVAALWWLVSRWIS